MPIDWTSLTDDAVRRTEDAAREFGALFEPTVRIGVTGLNRAGKTVFVTALVANLLNRGRMPMLKAEAEGRIDAAMLRPQPDPAVPRFQYEDHLAALTGPTPRWPDSTRTISELRVSMRLRRSGLWASTAEALTGTGTLHIDIVDYPGEWLLDLPLLNQSWESWRDEAIGLARRPERARHAGAYLDWLASVGPEDTEDETRAREGAARFTAYLSAARKAGLSAVSPGRFLLPGDLEGSPALTFAPVAGNGGFARLMRGRYDAYKRVVARPFFTEHFSKLDRQVVLLDPLAAIDAGPAAVADLQKAMTDILACFRHGENGLLSFLTGRRIERLLFAATKADHVPSAQHPHLTAIVRAMLAESANRAAYRGAKVEAMAIAALRSTVDQTLTRDGEDYACVRGRALDTGKEVAIFPGALPVDPLQIVNAAQHGTDWQTGDYSFARFAPPILDGRPGFGPPHLRLDRVAEFLFGDRM